MQQVKVKKSELLERLKANRDNHEKIFKEALDGYKKRVLELLERNLEAAKQGKDARLTDFYLQKPVNQIADYDRAIAMLGMSVEDEVQLSQQDFACYVQDDWGWKRNFLGTNKLYSATAAALDDSE